MNAQLLVSLVGDLKVDSFHFKVGTIIHSIKILQRSARALGVWFLTMIADN